MDKALFITKLRDSLSGLTFKEIEDIVADYEEHFRIGLEKGKSEAEISVSLGSPEEIALQYTGEKTDRAESSKNHDKTKMWVVAALLIAVNVTVFFTPLLTLFWVWFALWAVSFAAVAVGFIIAVAGLINVTIPILNFLLAPFLTLFGTGTVSLGIGMIIVLGWLTKLAVKAIKWWVNFNIDIARKAGGVNA
ncbi:MAG TPA: DUF1700 domain-containing protein [bacterium]|nr:DUF1700 domain-containing protein [bacterium]